MRAEEEGNTTDPGQWITTIRAAIATFDLLDCTTIEYGGYIDVYWPEKWSSPISIITRDRSTL